MNIDDLGSIQTKVQSCEAYTFRKQLASVGCDRRLGVLVHDMLWPD